MKTLVILAHPNIRDSKINQYWKVRLQKETAITIHDLYDIYPEHVINVEDEQKLLLAYDRIVFQFPFHWYSSPSLLKKWVDEVYTHGFAYGTENKLKGKEFCLVLSAGRSEDSYRPDGSSKYTMEQFLLPMKATVLLTEMTYLQPFVLYGAASIHEETLADSAEQLALYLTADMETHTPLQEEN